MSKAKTEVRVLRTTLKRLSNPKKWTKGAWGEFTDKEDESGKPVFAMCFEGGVTGGRRTAQCNLNPAQVAAMSRLRAAANEIAWERYPAEMEEMALRNLMWRDEQLPLPTLNDHVFQHGDVVDSVKLALLRAEMERDERLMKASIGPDIATYDPLFDGSAS